MFFNSPSRHPLAERSSACPPRAARVLRGLALAAFTMTLSVAITGCGVPDEDFLLSEQEITGGTAGPCDLVCPLGFKTDEAGQTYCECRDDDCNRAVPAPHHAPGSNACVSFEANCDIPDGWLECSNCIVNGVTFVAGETFTSDDGCTDCVCSADGVLDCGANGREACQEPPIGVTCSYDGDTFVPGESIAVDAGGVCTCLDDGMLDCVGPCITADGAVRPGESFTADDGCNACTCEGDNVAICTQLACTPVEATPTCFDDVDCDAIAPDCGPGRTPEIQNGCYGACVDVTQCGDLFFSCTAPVGGDFCDALPPVCDEQETLTYQGGCYGPCVDALLCETPTECAATFTCDVPAPQCEPGRRPATQSGCPTGECVDESWCSDG